MRGMPTNLGEDLRMSRSLIVTADGGSRGNPGPAAYGAVVYEGNKVLAEVSGKIGVATNNVAEYRGLIVLVFSHPINLHQNLHLNHELLHSLLEQIVLAIQ